MPLVIADRVLETCSSPGIGTVSLLGATSGYQTFASAIGNTNTCYYTIADQSGAGWEVGIGTVTTGSPNTLSRDTVLASSNAGSKVSFSSGTQNVFVTYPAEKAVYLNASGNITPSSLGPATFSSVTDSGLTSGRVTYASTGGLLADSANLTFNGTSLTLANDASINGLTVGKGAGAVASNTAVGVGALVSNTTGSTNTALGYAAGYSNTGSGITAVGYRAGYYSTTGGNSTYLGCEAGFGTAGGGDTDYSVAVGYRALYTVGANTDNITAIGSESLYSTTTGGANTAVGRQSLYSNTTASYNTALGYQAGYSNTVGTQCVYIGRAAGYTSTTGTLNTAIGDTSLYSNTSGFGNFAGGVSALYANTTGQSNVAIGNYDGTTSPALRFNTTGSYNIAIGTGALQANTTASSNIAVGYQAGNSNTTGATNTFIGGSAGYTSTGGSNTFIGYTAGYLVTTGIGNTFIGGGLASAIVGAGYRVTTGSKNTIIGNYDGNQGGLDIRTASNYIVLSDGDGNPRQIIDGSGNLGLGVTPSAWGSPLSHAIELAQGTGITAHSGSATSYYTSNAYYNGSNWIYKSSVKATLMTMSGADGSFGWNTAPSGTAGNAITFTQAMTLDASSNLAIQRAGEVYFVVQNTANNVYGYFDANASGVSILARDNGAGGKPLSFVTGTTTAMTIDTSGNLGIGTTSPRSKLESVSGSANINADIAGTAGAFVGTTGSAQSSIVSIESNDAIAANTGGVLGFGGRYLNTQYANWAAIKGLKDDATSGNYGGYLSFFTRPNAGSNIERMRIDSSGNLLVGQTSGSYNIISRVTTSDSGDVILSVERQQTGVSALLCYGVSQTNYNAANSAIKVGRVAATLRSINAGGTVNASGADYAEYMTKASDFILAKGDVVGIDANGKLTNVFADAISFVVKSTNPSYVGGDTWGTEEAIGLTLPKKPIRAEDDTDETFAEKEAQYTADKAIFDEALEAARQLVDRIAFAGQVPVNVLGATAGQYIIPVNDNGAIKGEAVSSPTFEQYQSAVGKVIAIESDGRARIIVKVA